LSRAVRLKRLLSLPQAPSTLPSRPT
jgi:hypothetical protein